MEDYNKYLKYKQKYLKLKYNMIGGNNCAANPVQPVSQNKYVCKKTLKYKDLKENEPTESDVYFVAEKLTEENYVFWNSYVEDQRSNTVRMGVGKNTEGNTISIDDGISSFKIGVNLDFNVYMDDKTYRVVQKPNDYTWIIYATNQDPMTEDIFFRKTNPIEMCCCLFIDKNIPITSHMGIFRNYKYFTDKTFRNHANLSVELHAFSAKISLSINPSCLYVVTRPVHIMRNILVNAIKTRYNTLDNIIYIGDNKQRENAIKEENKEYNKHIGVDSYYPIELDKKIPLEIGDTFELNNGSIKFNKPVWFKHGHLSNHLPLIMINTQKLGAMF